MIPADISVIEIWRESTAGTAKALTTSYVATEGQASLHVAPWNVVCLFPVMSGTVVTSLELLVEGSADGTNWNPVPTKTIAATLVTCDVGIVSLVKDASDRIPFVDIDVGAVRYLRVSAKRAGGDATSALLLLACGGSLR